MHVRTYGISKFSPGVAPPTPTKRRGGDRGGETGEGVGVEQKERE